MEGFAPMINEQGQGECYVCPVLHRKIAALEKRLAAADKQKLRHLKQRCLHDFVLLLLNSVRDTAPTDDPREVLRCMARAVNGTGIDDLGEGGCGCGNPDCPYTLEATNG
jgi:hypothetical protein